MEGAKLQRRLIHQKGAISGDCWDRPLPGSEQETMIAARDELIQLNAAGLGQASESTFLDGVIEGRCFVGE